MSRNLLHNPVSSSSQEKRPTRVRRLVAATCLALVLSLPACHHRPEHVIGPDRMTAILVDVHKAEGLLDVQQPYYAQDSDKQAVVAAVLAKHGVTKAEYDTALVWYSTHLKDFIRVYDKVKVRIQAESDSLAAMLAVARPVISGDSVCLWTARDYVIVDPRQISTLWAWEMAADTTYHAGDSLAWTFRIPYLPAGYYGVAALTARCDNAAATTTVRLDSIGSYALALRADSTLALAAVLGSVNLFTRSGEAATLPVVVDSICLMRYHRK